MSIPMSDLIEAYKAVHTIRRFANDHATQISLVTTMVSGHCVNPVALLHDTIQEATYARWMSHGGKPFIHEGEIVYWDHGKQKIAFTGLAQSCDLVG